MEKKGEVEEDIDMKDLRKKRIERRVVKKVKNESENEGYELKFRKRIGIDVGRIEIGERIWKGKRNWMKNKLKRRSKKRGI